MKDYYFYLITNWTGERIYAGVTNDLCRRIAEHKQKTADGHTKKYNISKLVYYEHFNSIEAAILREKEVKGWRREKKNVLVESMNPNWEELPTG